MLLPIVLAAQDTIGYYERDTCVSLIQTCANCTYVNFTAVYSPRGELLLNNANATKQGTMYNYSFCNTSILGEYIVNGVGDVNGVDTVFAYDFEVTYSGRRTEDTSVGLGVMIFLIIISVALFALSFRQRFVEQKYVNFIIRRSLLTASFFFLTMNTAIIATLADSFGLAITRELNLYMEIFGWIGYIAMIILVFTTAIQMLNQLKIDKRNKRVGDVNEQ